MKKSMRKIYSVILVLAMVIGLFPMGTVEAKANTTTQGNVSYEPLQLSKDVLEKTGGNAVGTATDYETAGLFPDKFFFYDKSYSALKGSSTFDGPMPEGGKIKVGEVDYQLADYEGKDCILLNRLDLENSSNTATLVLETIGVYDKVYVLATAGGVGASTSAEFSVTLTYTDNKTETTKYYLRDWFASGLNSNSIYTNIKRAQIGGGSSDAGRLDAGPFLQSSPIDVDESKLLKSITFTYEDKNDSLFCAVFGVTGVTPPGVPDAPTAKAASGKVDGVAGFTANWEPNGQGASEITGYYIDVAEDPNFTTIVSGYNNYYIDGGNTRSYEIKSNALKANTTYYYRVRAKNTQGQSLSSNRVATDLPSWIATALKVADHSKVTYDLDAKTAIFDETVSLIAPLTIPTGEPVSIYVPTGVTINGKEDQPAINAEIKPGETVSLTVYGPGTIKGGNGSDGDPGKPGQPAIDFSKATGTLVVDSEKDGVTKIIGGNGGNSTTAAGGDGGAGIYLSGNSTMQEKGTTGITGGKGGTGTGDSKGNDGIPVLREFSSSDITHQSYSGTYDGNAHKITVSAPWDATVTYSLSENGKYTTTNPTRTDATGEQPVTVYYKVEKEGYVPEKGSATITINRKSVSDSNIYVDYDDVAYTGKEITFSLNSVSYYGMTLEEGVHYEVEGTKKATEMGTYELVIKGKGNFTGTKTIVWKIKDLIGPTGEIKINDTNKWTSLIDTNLIEFDLFYKVAQTITITAEDLVSGLGSIQYYVSSSVKSLNDLADVSWSNYTGPVTIQPVGQYIVYAKLTDKVGNVSYISTNGIVVDNEAPVFDGITNDMSSNADEVKFEVDDYWLDKVLIDDKVVYPDNNGEYTVKKSIVKQTITAVDKAGNKTTIKVLVHGDRTAPTGVISIDEENSWSTLLEEYEGVFYNKAQEITIEADDAGMGMGEIEYYISEVGLYTEDTDGSEETPAWKPYTGPFTVEPDKMFVIYAKLTDTVGNVSYISSDIIVLDATAPVISGLVDEKVYCDNEVQFTAEDTYLDKVFIDGKEVEADDAGFYTVKVGKGVQVIEAVDISGNVTTYKITVNGCHTWKEPVVTWAEDELSATFDFVCKYDETHTYTKEVQATLEIEDGATGSQKGTITHVVKVDLDGKVYTAKQVNDTPVVEEEKIGDGKLTAKVEVAEDVPEVVVDDLDVDLVKDLLTEEQLESVEADGSQIEVSLKIETLKDAAPETDVKLVKDTLATIVKDLTAKNNYVSTEEVKSGIEYIDLSLYMKIDNNPEEKISQLKGKELTITMEIPENIKSDKKGRQYYVIRVHDGAEVEVLDSVIDLEAGTIKFKTDRFSTYAIVYTDVTDAEVNVPAPTPELPKTADSSDVELFVLTFVAGVYMIVCAEKKEEHNKLTLPPM